MPKKSTVETFEAEVTQNEAGDWVATVAETNTSAVGHTSSTAVRRVREALERERGSEVVIERQIQVPRHFEKWIKKIRDLDKRYDKHRKVAMRVYNQAELEKQAFIRQAMRDLKLKKVEAAGMLDMSGPAAQYMIDPKYPKARRLNAIRSGEITEDDPEFWRDPPDGRKSDGGNRLT